MILIFIYCSGKIWYGPRVEFRLTIFAADWIFSLELSHCFSSTRLRFNQCASVKISFRMILMVVKQRCRDRGWRSTWCFLESIQYIETNSWTEADADWSRANCREMGNITGVANCFNWITFTLMKVAFVISNIDNAGLRRLGTTWRGVARSNCKVERDE